MWLSGAYLSRAAQREISDSSVSVAISPLERKVGSSSSGQHHRHHRHHQTALVLQWEQDPFPPDLAPRHPLHSRQDRLDLTLLLGDFCHRLLEQN